MVMGRLAADVGMLAGRQVEALDDTQLGEHLERPEDGGSADAQAAVVGRRDELGRGEVAFLVGDQRGQRPARLGQPVPSTIKGVDDRPGLTPADATTR